MYVKILLFCGAFCVYAAIQANEIEAQIPSPEGSMAEFCTALPRAEYASLTRVESSSTWFEMYRVAPGVIAIYEPHQWQEAISYLIEGEQSALLFDTGNGIADIKAIVEKITDKPINVLNSHTHYDHVGGNYAFDNILAMDTKFTRERQAGHANKDIAIEVSSAALCRDLPNGVSEKNHSGRPFAVSQFIDDGHKINLGARQLEVIHLPGHTPDAIALIDRAAGLLWTGDSYYSGPIWLFAPETDLDAYAHSLDRLIKEMPNVKALLPAHNTPWVDPAVLPRVAAALQLMLKGKSIKIDQGYGMIEHKIDGETQFSFLLRDEPIPYSE